MHDDDGGLVAMKNSSPGLISSLGLLTLSLIVGSRSRLRALCGGQAGVLQVRRPELRRLAAGSDGAQRHRGRADLADQGERRLSIVRVCKQGGLQEQPGIEGLSHAVPVQGGLSRRILPQSPHIVHKLTVSSPRATHTSCTTAISTTFEGMNQKS